MTGPFDHLLDRVTAPLRVDGELQLDIRGELRTHLEESADEFAQSGCGIEEAQQQAMRALGDPDELAEQLYRANRRRIRGRCWLRRGALIALPLLAILVTGWPILSALARPASRWWSWRSPGSSACGGASCGRAATPSRR